MKGFGNQFLEEKREDILVQNVVFYATNDESIARTLQIVFIPVKSFISSVFCLKLNKIENTKEICL